MVEKVKCWTYDNKSTLLQGTSALYRRGGGIPVFGDEGKLALWGRQKTEDRMLKYQDLDLKCEGREDEIGRYHPDYSIPSQL